MKNQVVQEILEIILNIIDMDFDISNYEYYELLRKMSYSVWEKHHVELLEELRLLRTETDIDFQLFWFDCMGYPDLIPNRYSKSKSKYIGLSGRVPNTIENSLSEIGGFHDSFIESMEFMNQNLDIILSDRCRNKGSSIMQTIKLTFYGVEKFLCSGNYVMEKIPNEIIVNGQILSATELPMINSIFDIIDINKELLVNGKRLIDIEIISSTNEHIEAFIVFNDWSFKSEGVSR